MDKSKIEHLNKQEYTHLPHAEQEFENHEQTDVAIRPLVLTLVAIAAVLVVSYAGLWGMFQLFKVLAKNSPENRRITQVEASIRQVPEGLPALQGVPASGANPNTPMQDMVVLRERNVRVLAGQQPMNERMTQPGMPILRAMDEAMSRQIFKARAPGPDAGGDAATPGQQGRGAGGKSAVEAAAEAVTQPGGGQ